MMTIKQCFEVVVQYCMIEISCKPQYMIYVILNFLLVTLRKVERNKSKEKKINFITHIVTQYSK